jgi:hypothetical protein
MKTRFHLSRRWPVLLVLIGLVALQGPGRPQPQDLQGQLNALTSGRAFNFFTWETRALARKLLYGLLAPHRFMSDAQQSRFVLDYLDDVREAGRLADEIDRIYTNPEIADADASSAEQQATLQVLRDRMGRHAPIAEAILETQVSYVLLEAGFGRAISVLPPISGTFTPLPLILVVSPRERIESVYQQQLVSGLTAAEQTEIEDEITGELSDYATYVTNIGGLAAYPAMLLESSSIDWITDVVAHEWVHHYLVFHPLGWYYMRNGETRTINETTASILGDWAGYEVMLRFYEPLLAREKGLPGPLVVAEEAESEDSGGFDFRAEMAHTRVVVDRLLAEGKIKEAEWYMEAQRRHFVANGYRIRRLNQAYFAFHGAYASTPGGAAGEDPIGPLVRQYWAVSQSPAVFLRGLAPVVTLQDLRDLVAPA